MSRDPDDVRRGGPPPPQDGPTLFDPPPEPELPPACARCGHRESQHVKDGGPCLAYGECGCSAYATELALGRELRDAGAERAGGTEAERWRAWAMPVLELLASTGEPFGADDVEEHRRREDGPLPPHPNAIGALFLSAARRKPPLIVRSGVFAQAKGAQAHARRVELWRGVPRSAVEG